MPNDPKLPPARAGSELVQLSSACAPTSTFHRVLGYRDARALPAPKVSRGQDATRMCGGGEAAMRCVFLCVLQRTERTLQCTSHYNASLSINTMLAQIHTAYLLRYSMIMDCCVSSAHHCSRSIDSDQHCVAMNPRCIPAAVLNAHGLLAGDHLASAWQSGDATCAPLAGTWPET